MSMQSLSQTKRQTVQKVIRDAFPEWPLIQTESDE